MTGGTEIVKKWVKGLRESGSVLAKNENAVQALALSYNSFNTGVDKFN
jgi:hypothetical protein